MEQNRRELLKLCGAVGAGIGLSNFAGVSNSEAIDYFTADFVSGGSTDWGLIRKESFSIPFYRRPGDYVYMNNSTLGVTLKPVLRRMNDVQQIFSQGCDIDQFFSGILANLRPMRSKMGDLINAPSRQLELPYPPYEVTDYSRNIGNVDSVNEGMSLVADEITFREGDVILITNHERSGGRTMWELQRDRYGAKLIEIPLMVKHESERDWAG